MRSLCDVGIFFYFAEVMVTFYFAIETNAGVQFAFHYFVLKEMSVVLCTVGLSALLLGVMLS